MKKLFLVDVSSMFFRAFYAIPPLRTSKGLPSNALYGFLAMSIKLLRESRPDYLAYCFDRKEPSFRHEMFEAYKANRSEMPEDLEPQIPYIRQLTEKLGIMAVDKLGFEADDVIGTLAKRGEHENLEVTIVSGDKDFAQLVSPHVQLYDTMKNIHYDGAAVKEKWGVGPDQMIDYLAIVGDSSDNIPGVHGIGPKGALKLLSEYHSLEDIYEHISDVKGESVRAKLQESKNDAFLAKKLVTIVTDVPLDTTFEDLQLKVIHREGLKELLDELEFAAFMKKLFPEGDLSAAITGAEIPAMKSKSSRPAKKTEGRASAIHDEAHATAKDEAQAVASDKNLSLFASAGPAAKNVESVQWSLAELKKRVAPYDEIWAVRNERGFCLGHKNLAIQVDASLAEIGQVLAAKLVSWRGFDVKDIWHHLQIQDAPTPAWDSMLAAYVVKAGAIDDISKVMQTYLGQAIPDLASPEEVLHMEMKLENVLRERLAAAGGERVFQTLELPLVPVLYQMEKRGIKIDKKLLGRQSETLTVDVKGLEKEIFKLAGESFNIASPKQLGHVLFEKLKIPSVKKTKTGFSTDNDVLSKLSAQFPICERLISYRELTKLKSTYVDALPVLVNAQDGRIHTSFQQAVTQTGRLSSVNPNLQNIPIRTARGRQVRSAFVASSEAVLLSADYSQIELRVLAEITGDEGLTEAFRNDIDIHSATAAEIFSVRLQDVTAEHRRQAKAVNFGIAYGQGVFGLAEALEISRDEAKKIIEEYFKKYKRVKEYMLETVATAKDKGYVETLFGRRRYLDEFKSQNAAVRNFGERAAINAPIQGTASDLMKKAMIEIHDSSPVPMLLQVHDELLFECAGDDVAVEAQNIKDFMEKVAPFKVPLRVNVAWGQNWEDAHA